MNSFVYRVVVSVALWTLLCGCGALLPSTRKESAATKTADNAGTKATTEFAGRVEFDPEPSVTVLRDRQGGERVEVRPQPRVVTRTASSDVAQTASSKDDLSSNWSVSLPAGVKLILYGVGIIVVVIAIRYVYRYVHTTAFGAAIKLADETLSNRIRNYRARAIDTEAKPDDKVFFAAEVADIEAERGKLAAKLAEKVK